MLKVAFAPIYVHPLPKGHRFPMEKYELLPQQLMHEGTLCEENFFKPKPATFEQVCGVHSKSYVEKLVNLKLSPKEERKTGFKQSKDLIEREFTLAGGTIQNSHFALEYGCSLNIAGGTHHAFADRGEGFCLMNDIAISADLLIRSKKVKRILVVDLDVHQGNGTASIFKQNESVYTFSMHGKSNYPMQKENSDLDIPLNDNTKDEEYLRVLFKSLDNVISSFKPQFVFYLSGVDVLKSDKLGKLDLSIEGCKQRDVMVFNFCKMNNLPVAVSMGGGYSEDIKIILDAHSNTFRKAKEIFY